MARSALAAANLAAIRFVIYPQRAPALVEIENALRFCMIPISRVIRMVTILDGDDAAAGGRILSGSPLVLAPGASVTVLTGGSLPGEGHLFVLQIVDYDDIVAESDETNNMTAVEVPVL